MALSNLKGSLFDPLRQMWVVATPEEIVRQKLLHVMIHQLGYPKQLLAVEKQLSEIPHLKGKEGLPSRRADILCFGKNGEGFFPLLLIECKEKTPQISAKKQAMGYNHFVDAAYVALAGPDSAELIYPQTLPFLPTYQQLLENRCV